MLNQFNDKARVKVIQIFLKKLNNLSFKYWFAEL